MPCPLKPWRREIRWAFHRQPKGHNVGIVCSRPADTIAPVSQRRKNRSSRRQVSQDLRQPNAALEQKVNPDFHQYPQEEVPKGDALFAQASSPLPLAMVA